MQVNVDVVASVGLGDVPPPALVLRTLHQREAHGLVGDCPEGDLDDDLVG